MRSFPIPCAIATLMIAAAGRGPHGATASAGATAPASAHEGSIVTADSVRPYYRVAGTGRETVIVPLALFHTTQLDRARPRPAPGALRPAGTGPIGHGPSSQGVARSQLSDLDAIRTAVGADRWTPYAEEMMADRARRTGSHAERDLEARLARQEFPGKPAEECRARAAVSQPATFGDPALARLAPDVCRYPTEWPARIGAYFGALMGSIEGFDWTDSLVRVARIPRLVIHGERDNTRVEGNREWVAHQPNARLLVIPGAGHWPHYEQPEQTIGAIDTFLGGAWPGDSERVP